MLPALVFALLAATSSAQFSYEKFNTTTHTFDCTDSANKKFVPWLPNWIQLPNSGCRSGTTNVVGSCVSDTSACTNEGGTVNLPNHGTVHAACRYCCILRTCKIGSTAGYCRKPENCPGALRQADQAADDSCKKVKSGIQCCVPVPLDEKKLITCKTEFKEYFAQLGAYTSRNTRLGSANSRRLLSWAPYIFDVTIKALRDLDEDHTCFPTCTDRAFLIVFISQITRKFDGGAASSLRSKGAKGEIFTFHENSIFMKAVEYYGFYLKNVKKPSLFTTPDVFHEVFSILWNQLKLYEFSQGSIVSWHRLWHRFLPPPLLEKLDSGSNKYEYYDIMYAFSFVDNLQASLTAFGCGTFGVSRENMDGCLNGQGTCFLTPGVTKGIEQGYAQFCPQPVLDIQGVFCPTYPRNRKGDFLGVCCVKQFPNIYYPLHFTNGEYRNLVVAIDESVHEDPTVISDIAGSIIDLAHNIQRTTDGLGTIASAKIIYPSSWRTWSSRKDKDDLNKGRWVETGKQATYQNFYNADIRYVQNFTTDIRTVQLGTCGEPGVAIYVSPQIRLNKANSDRLMLQGWSFYRWGVFSEFPHTASEVSYVEPTTGEETPSSCTIDVKVEYEFPKKAEEPWNFKVKSVSGTAKASLSFLNSHPDKSTMGLSSVVDFCENMRLGCSPSSKHNPFATNPHNTVCKGQSALDVIKGTDDMKATTFFRKQATVSPVIEVVKQASPTKQIVILVDMTSDTGTPIYKVMLNSLLGLVWLLDDKTKVAFVRVSDGVYYEVKNGALSSTNREKWSYAVKYSLQQQGDLTVIDGLTDLYKENADKSDKGISGGKASGIGGMKDVLVFSDFDFFPPPTDNVLIKKISDSGDSIYSFITKPEMVRHRTSHFYFDLLANRTMAARYFTPDNLNMLDYYKMYAGYIGHAGLGRVLQVDSKSVTHKETAEFTFSVPETLQDLRFIVEYGYGLYHGSVEVTKDGSGYSMSCEEQYAGEQETFRVLCYKKRAVAGEYVVVFTPGDDGFEEGKFNVFFIANSILNEQKKFAESTQIVVRKSDELLNYADDDFKPALVYCVLSYGQYALLGAKVELLFQDSEGETSTKLLKDDGLGWDGFAADGVYTGPFQPEENGYHMPLVNISGETEFIEDVFVGRPNDPNVYKKLVKNKELGKKKINALLSTGIFIVVNVDENKNMVELGRTPSFTMEASAAQYSSSAKAGALPSVQPIIFTWHRANMEFSEFVILSYVITLSNDPKVLVDSGFSTSSTVILTIDAKDTTFEDEKFIFKYQLQDPQSDVYYGVVQVTLPERKDRNRGDHSNVAKVKLHRKGAVSPATTTTMAPLQPPYPDLERDNQTMIILITVGVFLAFAVAVCSMCFFQKNKINRNMRAESISTGFSTAMLHDANQHVRRQITVPPPPQQGYPGQGYPGQGYPGQGYPGPVPRYSEGPPSNRTKKALSMHASNIGKNGQFRTLDSRFVSAKMPVTPTNLSRY